MTPSLAAFFQPRGIAIIGASRWEGTVGWQIVDNLLRHRYQGAIYPVNPAAGAIHSIPAWRSVREIRGEVDLAVVVVPRDEVADVVEECGERGIAAVVIISAGFRETGERGAELERRLVGRIRELGMRLVGPNCMGVLNTDPAVSMNATFAPTMPPPGRVSFLSQSGALGVTILDYAAEYGIGIRHFLSVGNKPDVSGNDALEFWESDPGTRVILLYLESFGNPRHFTRIASRVARRKPIIAVKSGRSAAGARAASSHTGALAGEDRGVDALFAQCGVIRATSVEELFDLSMAFESLPLPRGNRVAIVTNAGGPGTIIADACEAEGLAVSELATETVEELGRVLDIDASIGNPIDMFASTTPETYRSVIEIVLRDPEVDAVIAAFVPPLGARQADVAGAIVAAARTRPDRPILAVLMGREGLPAGRTELRAAGIPAYTFPESAARALGAMHRHARWVARPVQAPVRLPADPIRATEILDQAATEGRCRLLEHEAYELLSCYGIPVTEHAFASTPDEALRAFRDMNGVSVVMKVVSPDIATKTEVGGVLLDVRDEAGVTAGWERLRSSVAKHAPEADFRGVLLTPFRGDGRQMILGMTMDPTFGPLLMFGLGGIYTEVYRDVAFRIPPVTELDAMEMIREIRSYPLLEGVRGEAAVSLDAVAEAIRRLSRLVLDHDRIGSVEMNPFLATPDGALALDARVSLVGPLAR